MIHKLRVVLSEKGILGLFKHFYAFLLTKTSPAIMSILNKLPPKKTVVFSHFAGKPYGGNPGMICDELIRRNLPYNLVWIEDNTEVNTLPREVKSIPFHSLRQIITLARAKVWVDDCRKPQYIRKGKKQYYIQTWHGGGPCLKKVEGDAEDTLSQSYIKDAKNDSKMADLFTSSCEWRTNNYRQAFWYKGEILKSGPPTSDVFLDNMADVRMNVCKQLEIKPESKILLYAPTFRNDHGTDYYQFNYREIIETLNRKFSGEWVLIVRLHPTIMNMSDFIRYDESIKNGSSYPRFEDLLIASEILITDYSGCMFDAYRLKKPVFIYATDYRNYTLKERQLYFNIKDMPASIAQNSQELIANILSFDECQYENRVDNFLSTIGYYPLTGATDAIVNRIIRVMEAN